MAKGKQGFFQSIRKHVQYLNKKKDSSKIMADLRKAEDDARQKLDGLNNQMNPLQVDLQAKNAHLQTLQSGLQKLDNDIDTNLSIMFDPTASRSAKLQARNMVIQLRTAKANLAPRIANAQTEINNLQTNIDTLSPNLKDAQRAFNEATGKMSYRTNYFNNYQQPSMAARAIGYTIADPKGAAINTAKWVGLPYGTYLWGNWSEDVPAQTPNPNAEGTASTGTGGSGNPPLPPGIPPQGVSGPVLPPGQGNVGIVTGTAPQLEIQNSEDMAPTHQTNPFEDALRAKLARDRIEAYQRSKQ